MARKINQLLDKPFDQYSRQKKVFDIATQALGVKNNKKTKIIDLGGHNGATKGFFNKSNVTILDIFDEEYDGYIKGDATNIDIADDTFDLVVSFDVLEHIERSKRKKFLSEALRVGRRGVFIAAPFDDSKGNVSAAERYANEVYRKLHGKDHTWLQEHISNRIPTTKEFEKLITDLGAEYVRISSNDLQIWTLFQTLIFLAERDINTYRELKKLEHNFNSNLDKYDTNPDKSYRKIYYISSDKTAIRAVRELCERNNAAKQTHEIEDYKSYLALMVLNSYCKYIALQDVTGIAKNA